jgi:hypothetical protein
MMAKTIKKMTSKLIIENASNHANLVFLQLNPVSTAFITFGE